MGQIHSDKLSETYPNMRIGDKESDFPTKKTTDTQKGRHLKKEGRGPST